MLHVMETTSKGWKHVGVLVDDQISVNAPPPTPPAPAVMGYQVGDCHTYTKAGKSIFNKQLFQANFDSRVTRRISTWKRGTCTFVATHASKVTTFERVS